MHVFLDSNVLYKDYFFDNSPNKLLLEYCRKKLIQLHVSDVVRLELRKQFIDEIEEKNREIKKVGKNGVRLGMASKPVRIDIQGQLDRFDSFFSHLKTEDNFHIEKYLNDFLPDIVDRAIYRKKPFTATKLELKDTIIWKTYSHFVETNRIDECVFLTANHTDFCDPDDPTRVHVELEKDTKRFTVIKDSLSFIQKYGSKLESPEHKLRMYLNGITIDNSFVYELLSENFGEIIHNKVIEKIEDVSPNDIMGDEFWHDGYVSPGEVELVECEDIQFELLKDSIFISGMMHVVSDVEVFEYNVARDPGEDSYNCIDEQNLSLTVSFSFRLSTETKINDFEIIDITLSDYE